jgi:hypothetical protein
MLLCEPQRGMFLSIMPLSENGRRIYAMTFFGLGNYPKEKEVLPDAEPLKLFFSIFCCLANKV